MLIVSLKHRRASKNLGLKYRHCGRLACEVLEIQTSVVGGGC